MTQAIDPASFRDPSGFVFTRGATVYRCVQSGYAADYDRLIASGLYDTLVGQHLLIPHQEVATDGMPGAHRVLRPEKVRFLSYPYEWCFSQLREAALATLAIQKQSLRHDMSLKDASAYNVQFVSGRPTLIDTLSFETYRAGRPWPAYRQFCQHFLAPLALMSRVDIRLGQLLRTHIDGIPLDLASRLLPARTRFEPGLLTHIHLHGAAQARSGASDTDQSSTRPRVAAGMGRTALMALVDSLEGAVKRLTWTPGRTIWGDYYDATNYSARAMEAKQRIVAAMLDEVSPAPRLTWDLGANTGLFSRIASGRGWDTVAWDLDPAAVEKCYLAARADDDPHLLPLVQDLTNPSPGLGWAHSERRSIAERGPADVVLALALVHHLAIGNNLPLGHIARWLRSVCEWLIIEFVPKSDSQVQRLLSTREDIFDRYTREEFEAEFGRGFEITRRARVPESERTLYLMRARRRALRVSRRIGARRHSREFAANPG